MALFNDPTTIDVTRFDRQDLRYGFGITFNGVFNSAIFQQPDLPNPKMLVLNPQSVRQSEPNAVNIRPTQDGGLVIENRGHIIKNITVAGNTGFLPLSARVGLLPGGATPNIRKGIGGKSGYNEFLQLRNLFREYGRIKRTPPKTVNPNAVQMVFLNNKDNEYWIVEPRTFELARALPRKTLYPYSIQLVAVGKFDKAIPPIDFLDNFGDAGIKTRKILDSVEAVEDFIRDIEASAAILGGNIAKAAAQILGPATAFSNSARSVLRGTSAIISVLPDTLNEINIQFINMLDAASDLGTTLPLNLVEAGFRSLHTINAIRTRPDVFRLQFSDKWEDVKKRYRQFEETAENSLKGQVSRRGMDSVKEATVYSGENIFRYAQRILGDASRFMDIVVLNKLVPPYIVENSVNRPLGTVAPGDSLLVPTVGEVQFTENQVNVELQDSRPNPTTNGTATSGTATTLKDTSQEFFDNQWAGFVIEIVSGTGTGQTRFIDANTKDTFTISPDWTTPPDATSAYKVFLDPITFENVGLEAQFGVDLRLAKDRDLIPTPSSDVALVRGLPNLSQAVDIKFETEQGELPLHLDYGFNIGVGTKGTRDNVSMIKIFAMRTFLQDPRIDTVEDVDVDFRDGKLSIVSKLKPKNSDVPQFADISLPG